MRTCATPWVDIEKRLRAPHPEVDDDLRPWRIEVHPDECQFFWEGCRATRETWVLEDVRKLLVDLESDPPSLQGSRGHIDRTRWTGKVVATPWSLSIDKHNVTFGEGYLPLLPIPTCLVIEAIRLLDVTEADRRQRPSEIYSSSGEEE